ncbi:MAG: dTDP-4-dehydrorhamnose reductase family protein [Candidatus Heimdallarchaeota archaeon]
MKVLIFGITGMLGHKVYQVLSESSHEIIGTMRKQFSDMKQYEFYKENTIVENLDVENFSAIQAILEKHKPHVVINCIGIIKPLTKKIPVANSITINSLFPHKLNEFCQEIGARYLHISTDCVFSGKDGGYTEDSIPDASDLYGLSKLLGEVTEESNALTIRTSIIGRELGTQSNLVEWVLSQKGKEVNGFANAIFTGVTTKTLSDILLELIEKPEVHGLLHVGGEKVDKFVLLNMMNESFALNMKVNKHEDFHCDRSFDSAKFKSLNIKIPKMQDMIEALSKEKY